jgi:hypothetical protein
VARGLGRLQRALSGGSGRGDGDADSGMTTVAGEGRASDDVMAAREELRRKMADTAEHARESAKVRGGGAFLTGWPGGACCGIPFVLMTPASVSPLSITGGLAVLFL